VHTTASRRLVLVYGAIGFSPITALALWLLGICPLPLSASALIGSALLVAAVLARRFPGYCVVVFEGVVAGLLAVFAYDAARWHCRRRLMGRFHSVDWWLGPRN
jgi:hypothetical protein